MPKIQYTTPTRIFSYIPQLEHLSLLESNLDELEKDELERIFAHLPNLKTLRVSQQIREWVQENLANFPLAII